MNKKNVSFNSNNMGKLAEVIRADITTCSEESDHIPGKNCTLAFETDERLN